MCKKVTAWRWGYPRLNLRLSWRRRQFVGLHRALKPRFLVAAIAKWLSFRRSAAAEADLRPSAQSVGVTILVYHFHHAINQQRPIIHNRDFYIRHPILRS